ETVSVEPSRAVPEIAGAVRFAGGAGTTLSLGMSRDVALPAAFVAVTLRIRTWPTSAPVSVSASAVAPVIAVQALPVASQRLQRYVYVSGSVPVQVPRVPVRISPSRAVPATVGATVLTGGAAAPVGLAVVDASVDPAAFVAVTTTRTVLEASAAARVYVVPVAFAMSVQFAPFASHRRHWYA